MKLWLRVSGLFLAVLLVGVLPSATQAHSITLVLDVEITSSSAEDIPVGAYPAAGAFSVDAESVGASGRSRAPLLDFSLTLGDETWFGDLDAAARATFEDGELILLDFLGENPGGRELDIFDTLDVLEGGMVVATGTYDAMAAVPEPVAVVLLGAALALLARVRVG